MSVSKGLRSNSRVQYKKCVIDMWEDEVQLFLFILIHGFFNFLFSHSCCALGRVENAYFLRTTFWGSIKPIMSILKLVKMRKLVCFYAMSSIHSMSSLSQHLSKKDKKKEKKEKKNKEISNLGPSHIVWFFVKARGTLRLVQNFKS